MRRTIKMTGVHQFSVKVSKMNLSGKTHACICCCWGFINNDAHAFNRCLSLCQDSASVFINKPFCRG